MTSHHSLCNIASSNLVGSLIWVKWHLSYISINDLIFLGGVPEEDEELGEDELVDAKEFSVRRNLRNFDFHPQPLDYLLAKPKVLVTFHPIFIYLVHQKLHHG